MSCVCIKDNDLQYDKTSLLLELLKVFVWLSDEAYWKRMLLT